jgi:hypothetical protein
VRRWQFLFACDCPSCSEEGVELLPTASAGETDQTEKPLSAAEVQHAAPVLARALAAEEAQLQQLERAPPGGEHVQRPVTVTCGVARRVRALGFVESGQSGGGDEGRTRATAAMGKRLLARALRMLANQCGELLSSQSDSAPQVLQEDGTATDSEAGVDVGDATALALLFLRTCLELQAVQLPYLGRDHPAVGTTYHDITLALDALLSSDRAALLEAVPSLPAGLTELEPAFPRTPSCSPVQWAFRTLKEARLRHERIKKMYISV